MPAAPVAWYGMYRLLFLTVLSRAWTRRRAHHLASPSSGSWPRRSACGRALRRSPGPLRSLARAHPRSRLRLAVRRRRRLRQGRRAVIRASAHLGFGHVEVGTLTALAQAGNPRPRLFRLIPDRAVINRMGFNNRGARMPRPRRARDVCAPPHRARCIGVNIGKSRVVDVDDAIGDYLAQRAPARPAGRLPRRQRVLAEHARTARAAGARQARAAARARSRDAAGRTPLLVKIAPDLADDEVRRIAGLAVELGLAGIIATNTTISREGLRTDPLGGRGAGAGGLSGAPLAARSLEVLRIIRAVVPAELCVISVGGVETAADVAERLACRCDPRAGLHGVPLPRPALGAPDQPRTARGSDRPASGSGQAGRCPRLTCGFGRRINRIWNARIAAYQRTPRSTDGRHRTSPRACASP